MSAQATHTNEVGDNPRIFADVREWRSSWILLMLADVVALELCVLLGYVSRWSLSSFWPIDITVGQYGDIAVGVLALPLAFLLLGLYPGYGVSPVLRLRQRMIASLVVFSLLITWSYLQQRDEISRGILLASMAYALAVPFIVESLVRGLLIQWGLWGQPTVLLGAGDTGKAIVEMLQRRPELGYYPIAMLDDDTSKWGTEYLGIKVLGPISLARSADPAQIRTAIFAMPKLDGRQTAAKLERLPFENVIIVPHLFGLQSLWVSTIDLEAVVGLQVKNNLQVRHNYWIKRAADYGIALPAAIISLPIILAAALWIMVVDGAPAFFLQERRGFNGRKIRVFKLRTMYRDAEERLEAHLAENPEAREEWNRFFKLKNDPRLLPGIGGFLRRTSLDELPQVFNVLLGQMTLVGPRPFPDYHLSMFNDNFKELRASVPPGVTGLWQVSARSDGDLQVQQSLDSYYIRNWSLWLDLYILIRTFVIVIRGKGAY